MMDRHHEPQSAEDWIERSRPFGKYHLTFQEIACLDKALALEPLNFEARRRKIYAKHWIREKGYLDQEFVDYFQDLYQQREQMDPRHFYYYNQDVASMYLFYLYGSPEHTDAEILKHYGSYVQSAVRPWDGPLEKRTYPTQDTSQKLRVGYIGREFDDTCSCMQLLRPMLLHHSASIEVFVYDDTPHFTLEKRELFKHKNITWYGTADVTNQALGERIRADRIDVLVDVAGPTFLMRNGVFWERPAPVMVGGLGFVYSSAKYLDYCLSDRVLTPPELAVHYPETIKYLPSIFLWDMPEAFPCERRPGNGLTLGSANSLNKLNLEVIALWSELLRRLPEATLFIKNSRFNDPLTQQMYMKLFAHFGIDASRLRLEKGLVKDPHLPHFYNQIDIALDTFPYQGAITTCDALWMGVPVVSLRQQGWEGRALGATILDHVGRSEWVVNTQEAYLQKVIELVHDGPARERYRHQLRQELAASRLCDPVDFCAHIEQAYFEMYQETRQRANAAE